MDPPACKQRLGWSPQSFHVLFASSNGESGEATVAGRSGQWRKCHVPGVRRSFITSARYPTSRCRFWLNASDALLLTSMHEGSPTVVKEALACGLPVVSVDVGDVAERIEGIEGCHLASPEPAELAGKLMSGSGAQEAPGLWNAS